MLHDFTAKCQLHVQMSALFIHFARGVARNLLRGGGTNFQLRRRDMHPCPLGYATGLRIKLSPCLRERRGLWNANVLVSFCLPVCLLSVCNHFLYIFTSYEQVLKKCFGEVGMAQGSQSIRLWWRSDNLFPYFALIFHPHSNVLVFARWQHHNATAIKQRLNGCSVRLIRFSIEDFLESYLFNSSRATFLTYVHQCTLWA